MTTINCTTATNNCPAEDILKLLAGKWKPQIFRLAVQGPLRFNTLLRQLPGSNKQSLSVSLRDLEQAGLLIKTVVRLKPLHIEYALSDKGKEMIPVFENLEGLMPRVVA